MKEGQGFYMKEVLRVRNLGKEKILKDISFLVERGEMVAIMGPSGSGKSTLLYQIAGMDEASGGEICLEGREITGLDEEERARVRLHEMGFVFQQMNMLPELTLLDNILLPAVCADRHRKKGERKTRRGLEEKAYRLMEKLSVRELADRRITEVSGGQLQRACICRSMMNDPKLLLADEPTGALNRKAADEVMEEFVRLNRGGATILMVTHDSRVACRCSRILYLLDGSIRGELRLSDGGETASAGREDTVKRWLGELGW